MYTLSNDVVAKIQTFIKAKLDDERLKNKFPNPLLREDILSMLNMYCTVVYYPLPEETINGFNLPGIIGVNGEEKTFVYINTAQTIEKQVFTAAHELGHIWGIDTVVSTDVENSFLCECGEKIINRFAAELLMPEDLFIATCVYELERYKENEKNITISNILKVITNIMTHFFVPYKAVVHRLGELKFLSEDSVALLLGESNIPLDKFLRFVNQNLKNNGYTNFVEPSEKRWIDGLADLLDTAQKQKSVTNNKIDKLREHFDLNANQDIGNTLDKKVNISIEEDDEDA